MKHLVPLLLAMGIYPTLSTHLEARMQVNEQTEAIQLATRKGKVYGRGKTKGDAYADAAGKIPNGSTPGKAHYTGSDRTGWGCWLEWRKD